MFRSPSFRGIELRFSYCNVSKVSLCSETQRPSRSTWRRGLAHPPVAHPLLLPVLYAHWTQNPYLIGASNSVFVETVAWITSNGCKIIGINSAVNVVYLNEVAIKPISESELCRRVCAFPSTGRFLYPLCTRVPLGPPLPCGCNLVT